VLDDLAGAELSGRNGHLWITLLKRRLSIPAEGTDHNFRRMKK
jgi:hypothetical protein